MTDLATIDGKNLEAFKKDPVNALLYSMAMEKHNMVLKSLERRTITISSTTRVMTL